MFNCLFLFLTSCNEIARLKKTERDGRRINFFNQFSSSNLFSLLRCKQFLSPVTWPRRSNGAFKFCGRHQLMTKQKRVAISFRYSHRDPLIRCMRLPSARFKRPNERKRGFPSHGLHQASCSCFH